MEFGIFHEFPAARTEVEAFERSFALVDAAERFGLDAVWLAELHMVPRRSVLSAPIAVASAIAATTSRIKIGMAVQVLPLGHPLRIAEEAATLDHISHGRLIFGVGRSGAPHTYEAYGVPYPESRDRLFEEIEIIRRAWTEPKFSYEGKFFSFHDVSITPKPFQKPFPPIRVAANSPDTFSVIGKLGYPIFVAVRLGTILELAPNIKSYREAYKAAGHPGNGEVYLRVPVYIADTYDKARSEPEESIMYFFRYMGAHFQESATHAGARAIEQRVERGRRLQAMSYDEALRDKLIVGTPEMVVERLRELQQELGLDGILAEINCGNRIPQHLVVNSLRLMCERVMPQFN